MNIQGKILWSTAITPDSSHEILSLRIEHRCDAGILLIVYALQTYMEHSETSTLKLGI